MSSRARCRALLPLLILAAAARAAGQNSGAPPPQSSDQTPPEAAPPRRPPEGSIIIDLPSADTIPEGSLQFWINHRFDQPVQDSDIHSIYSFFSPAHVGLGLSYAPTSRIEAGFFRAPDLEDYEVFAKARLYGPAGGPFAASLRVGGDFRTARGLEERESFFAQAILAFTFASRVRLTAVPTYVSKNAAPFSPSPLDKDVWNVPIALSIAITRSINLQGEMVPRMESPGIGWIAAIEKTVLRHRFSFTVGNLQSTSVDQYVRWNPAFVGGSVKDVHFGFNITRLWKIK